MWDSDGRGVLLSEPLVPHHRWKLGASKGMKGGEGARVRELGAPGVLGEAGAALCRDPPAQPVCCCCARCAAGRAQNGTAVLAPVRLGEQEPAEEHLAAGTDRATGCGTREQPGHPVPVCGTAPAPSLCPPWEIGTEGEF